MSISGGVSDIRLDADAIGLFPDACTTNANDGRLHEAIDEGYTIGAQGYCMEGTCVCRVGARGDVNGAGVGMLHYASVLECCHSIGLTACWVDNGLW